MRIALVSDIHGNRWALAAVLEHIDRQRVDAIWNLGDILSGPLEPAATADMLMALALPTIRGNCERGLLDCAVSAGGASDRFGFEHTDARHREWLASLPATLAPRPDVLLCHGTPRSDTEPLLETLEHDADRPRAAYDSEIAERVSATTARLVACGHTHMPRLMRTRDGCTIVNPGSVGLPAYDDSHPLAQGLYYVETGSPHASYAVIEDTDTDTDTDAGDGYDVTFHRVTYDWESAAALAARNHRPEWAHALRTGFALR